MFVEQNKLCGLSLSLSLSLSNNRQSSLLPPHPSALCFHPPARSMTRQLLQQYCDYRVTTAQSMSAPANSRLLETPGVFLALAGAEQAIRRVGIILKEMFPSRDIAMFDINKTLVVARNTISERLTVSPSVAEIAVTAFLLLDL